MKISVTVPLLLALLLPTLLLGGYRLVGHPDLATHEITRSELKSIYLGKKSKWEDGSPVKAVTLRKGEAHKAFLRENVNKTPAQFRIFWKRAIFTGKLVPFQRAKSDEEVLRFVRETAGSIGYVSETVAIEGLREVQIR